jgi:hypothetical protein
VRRGDVSGACADTVRSALRSYRLRLAATTLSRRSFVMLWRDTPSSDWESSSNAIPIRTAPPRVGCAFVTTPSSRMLTESPTAATSTEMWRPKTSDVLG